MDCRAPIRRASRIVLAFLGIGFACILSRPTQAQVPAGTAAPPRNGSPQSADSIQQQLDAMRIEVNESRKLRQQVSILEAEVLRLKMRPTATAPANRATQQRVVPQPQPRPAPEASALHASYNYDASTVPLCPSPDDSYCLPDDGNPPPPAPRPLFVTYGYNFGGGYTQLGDPNEEFTVKLQNQLTLDGTFYNQPNMPTAEKGFNIPFYRTYLYGNITKDWDYQLAVQGFLGEFNMLDGWVNYTVNDAVHFRVGRMLSPFLYEYWGFSPAWEPVITNSLLFQVAGKRQMGGMLWGRLAANRIQYQAGVFTGIEGGFYDLDRSVDFLGSLTFTPWKDRDDLLDSLGFGMSVQTGMQNYALNAGNTESFINGAGEPTLNFNYINSTGIPFFQYHDDVMADGMRTKFAPHVFWYGRMSVQAEYVWQQRQLADSTRSGSTILQGWQTTLAYLLTGESRKGDGLGGWVTVDPRSPFVPSKGEYGPGAWELAFQYSELDVGTDNFQLGFADPATSTNRLLQTMLGINWWPNRYTRLSFDWMHNKLNRAVPTGTKSLASYDTLWTRLAMFF